MAEPLIALPDQVLVNGGTTEIDLSLGIVHRFLMLYLTVDATSSAVDAPPEDGWGAFIERISIEPSGVDSPLDLDGYSFIQQGNLDAGGPAIANMGASAIAAYHAEAVLPLFFELPDAGNPLNALFDPRGLPSFRLRLTMRDFADLWAVSAMTDIIIEARVLQCGLSAVQPVAGAVMERRARSMTFEFVGAGETVSLNLKRGGILRRIMLVTRDGAPFPGAGVRSDEIIDRISVRQNTANRIWDNVSFWHAHGLPFATRDYVCPVGFGCIQSDPEGTVADGSMIPASGVGLESLDIEFLSLAAGHVTMIPEYLVLRGR